jgi:hypothetical protein
MKKEEFEKKWNPANNEDNESQKHDESIPDSDKLNTK